MPSGKIVDLRSKKPGARPSGQAPLPLRPQKRVSPVRVQRRRTRSIVAAIILALLVSATLCLSYVSYMPKYSVGTITVQGAQRVSASAVADYAGTILYDGSHHFFSRANIFLYPKALIEKDIPLEFPRIASASIASPSLLSNAITITVVERQPFALWCDENTTCYEMDQNGYLFAQAAAQASSTDQYVFSGGIATSSPLIGQTFAPGHTPGLVAFLQLLSQSGFTPLGASVQSDQDFTVPLSQGFSIYASFGEDPSALVTNLQLVLSSSALSGQEQSLEYVDLRFGDKVYYKLKGQTQQQSSQ
jgi:cell division septal protein FtsQ